MRLLVVNLDRHLGEIIRSVVAGEGHEVLLATSGGQASRMVQDHRPELVLCAMELGQESGVQILRRLREMTSDHRFDAILMSGVHSRGSPQVQAVMGELEVRDFLPLPFSVLDLMDTLRRLERPTARAVPAAYPQGTDPLPAPAGQISARNAARLARLWTTHATGILHIADTPGVSSGWVTLQGGGPAHAQDWELLRALLQGGRSRFEGAVIEGRGDWLGMGRFLFSATRDAGRPEFAQQHRYDAVLCAEPLEVLCTLPLAPMVRQLLTGLRQHRTLGEQVAQLGITAEEIGADLYALRLLRLIFFQPPMAAPPSPQLSTLSRSALRREPDSHSSTSLISARRRRRARTGAAATPAARRRLDESLSSTAHSTTTTTSPPALRGRSSPRQDPDVVRYRLRRELQRLRDARPEVILGIPADADAKLLQRSARRMHRRYKAMARDRRLDRETRELASELKSLMIKAYRKLHQQVSLPLDEALTVVPLTDEEKLLKEGIRLIGVRSWRRADAVLTRAHQIRIDHAGILANLGWARFHREDSTPEERTEAMELVMLAAQFDEADADIQYFLTRMYIEQGDRSAALRHARQGLRSRPDDARLITLEQELSGDASG